MTKKKFAVITVLSVLALYISFQAGNLVGFSDGLDEGSVLLQRQVTITNLHIESHEETRKLLREAVSLSAVLSTLTEKQKQIIDVLNQAVDSCNGEQI